MAGHAQSNIKAKGAASRGIVSFAYSALVMVA